MSNSTSETFTDKLIVSVEGDDLIMGYVDLGLTFQSSEPEILRAVQPMLLEKFGQNINGEYGWTYKVHKAVDKRNIHLYPNSTAGIDREHQLAYLNDQERLTAYEFLTKGCVHLWSKNQLQEEKLKEVLDGFGSLAEKDPLFLAHFTSYAIRKLDSKDIKVVLTYLNSLSDADGTPFYPGAEFSKPNWRRVSQAALQQLDPKLALRVVALANRKMKVGTKAEASHFSTSLKTALKKYLRYREANPKVLQGIQKAGLSKTVRNLYREARIAPNVEAVKTLRWKQKPGYPGHGVTLADGVSFQGLSDLQIAEKIRKDGLSPQVVLGSLPDKISPVIAAAILENSTGDQTVVLTSMFEDQGLLKNAAVQKVYAAKIATAKSALDRVDRMKAEMHEEVKVLLKNTRSEKRKEELGDFGKVFIHIDKSGSMHQGIEVAKDRGALLAEFVKNPEENFNWGLFNEEGHPLPRPAKFTKDAFMAALYNQRAGGGTNIMALYEASRKFGTTTDIFITDQEQTAGAIEGFIDRAREKGYSDPRMVIVVHVGNSRQRLVEEGFQRRNIPVVRLDPDQLVESALVTQAVRAAFKGATALIDEIMETPLLELPSWWESVRMSAS